MSARDDLLAYIFDGRQPALYPEFARWLQDSRRFQAFALAHRDKIRAKVRSARDDAGLKDLRAELYAAVVLLGEGRFGLEYEKYVALKQRGPDFTVTFRTHIPFNVEVRRLRGVELEAATQEVRVGKLMTVLCDKVGQMPPSIANLLWLTAEGGLAAADLSLAVATLRGLAEGKVEAYFNHRGFESAAAFLKQYGRLSGIVLPQQDGHHVWLNPLARHKVPPEIATAIHHLPSR